MDHARPSSNVMHGACACEEVKKLVERVLVSTRKLHIVHVSLRLEPIERDRTANCTVCRLHSQELVLGFVLPALAWATARS